MPNKKSPDLTYADVTPKGVYMGRRNFLLGLLATGAAVEGYKKLSHLPSASAATNAPVKLAGFTKWPGSTTEEQTPLEKTTHYNNFYEFGTGKGDPAENAKNFVTVPWTVSVEGEVKKPRKFSMDEIMKLAPLEERIYRHRCVEAWSIVVPWIGYPFSALAKLVEPTAKAKYVAFESYYDLKQMPEGPMAGIELPYVEGLRLDEAMHPLTLAHRRHVRRNAAQSGRRARAHGDSLEVRLQEHQVDRENPLRERPAAHHLEHRQSARIRLLLQRESQVDHPRWSQAHERRLGGLGLFDKPIPTLMFNGYGDQVASLYTGMDLRKNY